uniref:Kininogen 1 n=2 Tax=Nothobranchius rachovii TaxID=451742 RepID=A0A1A8RY58_9TELE
MRTGAELCVLGLLSLCSSVFTQEAVEPHRGVLIFCDDPSVEKAVSSALQTINKRITTGHKMALFQILSASKSENGSDSVYSLEFTSRKSDCPADSSKPWTECDYHPQEEGAPVQCNATVHMTETEVDTRMAFCMTEKLHDKTRAPCLGCPMEISDKSEDLKAPLSAAISRFNAVSNSTHLFALHSVGYATRQVVAGFRFNLMFDMKRTTCAKAEHKDLSEQCVTDEKNLEFANCNSVVDVAPWRLEQPSVYSECQSGLLATVPTISKRRPPGWSPLRSIPRTTAPPTQSSPAAQPTSKAPPAREESSEEDTTASKSSASPSVNNNLFHCPTKPWKPFKLASLDLPAPPTAATDPSVEGVLSDTDLLPSSSSH